MGLFKEIERLCPAPSTGQILSALASEKGRIDLACDLGKREVVDYLRMRYKIQ